MNKIMERLEYSFRFLIVSRAMRSISISFAGLSIPLYLLALKYNIIFVGIVYFILTLTTSLITFTFGFLGDRIGYKKILIIAEILPFILFLILSFSNNPVLIIAGIIVSGVGGGPGAMRGAFSPGTSALIAKNWPDERDRIKKIGTLSAVGAFSSIGGAVLLYFHGFIQPYLGNVGAFRLLYLFSLILIIISIVSLIFVQERKGTKKVSKFMEKESGKYSLKVILANSINGIGLGFSVMLLSAWLEIRYNVSPSQIGLLFIFSYFITAIASYLATRVEYEEKNKVVYFGSLTRVMQGLLLIIMAIMPSFILSGVVYSIRSFFAGFGQPIRTAVNVRGIKEGDYGTATSIQGIAGRISQSTSGAAGYLMDIYVPLPLILGGMIQAFGGYVYYKIFRS